MSIARRFLTGFRQTETNEPGLELNEDGTVDLVNPDGSRTALPGGSSTAVVTVSSAQLLAIDVNEVTLIAAPGAGRVIIPGVIVTLYTFGSAPYLTNTTLDYGLGTSSANLSGRMSNLISGSADNVTLQFPGPNLDGDIDDPANVLNQPFVLGTGGNAAPTAGDGTLKLVVTYDILTIT